MWQLGPVTLYTFGLGLSLIFLIGSLVGQSGARRQGINPTSWWRLSAGLAFFAAIGGRSVYLLRAQGGLLDFWQPPVGGLSYLGAVVSGVLYLAVVARLTRRPLMPFLDLWAIPWMASILTAAVLWGAPLNERTTSSALYIFMDIIYLTGAYGLIWAVSVTKRKGRAGAAFLAAASGDSALKMVIGFLGWIFVGSWAQLPWYALVFRIGFGVIALYVLKQYVSKSRRGQETDDYEVRFPLTRWIGWIVAYAFLLTLMIVIAV